VFPLTGPLMEVASVLMALLHLAPSVVLNRKTHVQWQYMTSALGICICTKLKKREEKEKMAIEISYY